MTVRFARRFDVEEDDDWPVVYSSEEEQLKWEAWTSAQLTIRLRWELWSGEAPDPDPPARFEPSRIILPSYLKER